MMSMPEGTEHSRDARYNTSNPSASSASTTAGQSLRPSRTSRPASKRVLIEVQDTSRILECSQSERQRRFQYLVRQCAYWSPVSSDGALTVQQLLIPDPSWLQKRLLQYPYLPLVDQAQCFQASPPAYAAHGQHPSPLSCRSRQPESWPMPSRAQGCARIVRNCGQSCATS
jgi:hypothetical protein